MFQKNHYQTHSKSSIKIYPQKLILEFVLLTPIERTILFLKNLIKVILNMINFI